LRAAIEGDFELQSGGGIEAGSGAVVQAGAFECGGIGGGAVAAQD